MTPPMSLDYDQAADDYAASRHLHAGVFRELSVRGNLGAGSWVLEVGCGTGNYATALAKETHCRAIGLDRSPPMLTHARVRSPQIPWLVGCAEHLQFRRSTFDLVFSVDVIHHVHDSAEYFCEVARVLRPGALVCTVTDSADIIRRRKILSGYFPETVDMELARYPRIAQLECWMRDAGLARIRKVNVEEPFQIDSSEPFRTKAYSALHLIPTESWQAGLERLERDLAQHPIRGMVRYACLWGCKPAG